MVKQGYEKTSKDVERLSVPGNASDQLQECETSITQLSQMSALLQKYQNIQNYYMSWTSRVERLNVPREW